MEFGHVDLRHTSRLRGEGRISLVGKAGARESERRPLGLGRLLPQRNHNEGKESGGPGTIIDTSELCIEGGDSSGFELEARPFASRMWTSGDDGTPYAGKAEEAMQRGFSSKI